MTDKPWWLWKGAAVRDVHAPLFVGQITDMVGEEDFPCVKVLWCGNKHSLDTPIEDLIPESNSAVTLAPEGATHVMIDHSKRVTYGTELANGQMNWWDRTEFHWSQCPDHLKGHTWPLPKGDQ